MASPSKIDVFFRTRWYGPKGLDSIRQAMSNLCLHRWEQEPVNIRLIRNMPIKEGREIAGRTSLSDPYIFTDDDCLIVGVDWVNRAVKTLVDNPKFAIVSCLSLVEGENLAKPSTSDPIYPMHMVGQPMLIRKGICTDLPDMDLNSECGVLHKLVLDKGYEEGLFHPDLRLRHSHLGHGFSSNPLHFWGF